MSEFVVYHNPTTMGYPATEVEEPVIVTNKDVGDEVVGSRVWLITSEGTPKTYYLCGWFTAERVTKGRGKFSTQIEGTWGYKIGRKKWPALNSRPWFSDFRSTQGNFGFGFNPIRKTSHVRGLEAATK